MSLFESINESADDGREVFVLGSVTPNQITTRTVYTGLEERTAIPDPSFKTNGYNLFDSFFKEIESGTNSWIGMSRYNTTKRTPRQCIFMFKFNAY